MADTRKKDVSWTVPTDSTGTATFAAAQLAVLMDLRDELQKLNNLLHCSNFTGMPETLRRIERNGRKKKRKQGGQR